MLGLSICEITTIVASKLPSDAASRITDLLTFTTPAAALSLGITPIFLCGWALNLAGTLFRVACYHTLGQQSTVELSIRENHRLVTTGPYVLVRHPSYTGAILSGMSALLAHLSRGSWVMECLSLHGLGVRRRWICVGAASIAALALVPRMNKEDRMLKNQFGKNWENWKGAVPHRLFAINFHFLMLRSHEIALVNEFSALRGVDNGLRSSHTRSTMDMALADIAFLARREARDDTE
ncbi:hypothetical protein PTI98_007095 [Pleurotus ostreatus]|nr:hypothetical protein PTI98_007095 [Pleurotus ostreatus]